MYFLSLLKFLIYLILSFPLHLLNIPSGDIKLIIYLISVNTIDQGLIIIFFGLIIALSFLAMEIANNWCHYHYYHLTLHLYFIGADMINTICLYTNEQEDNKNFVMLPIN